MMLLLTACVALLVTPGLAFEGPAISSEDLPPEPSPQYREHLHQCALKVTEKCGNEIFYSTFFNNVTMTKGCCIELTEMGKRCHDDLVNFLLQAPVLKNNVSEILPRSEHIWNRCVWVAYPLKPLIED